MIESAPTAPAESGPPAMSEPAPSGDMASGLPPAPTPTDVIPADLVSTLAEAVNEAGSHIMGDDFPPVPVGNPSDAKRGIGGTKRPVEPQVWTALVVVGAVVSEVAAKMPEVQALVFDPKAITTTAGMRDVVSKLDQISRSADVKKGAEEVISAAKSGMSEDESGEPPESQTPAEEAGPEEPEPPEMK